MLVFNEELLTIFLITELNQGDDRDLYELIGKMIKPKEERIGLPEVIEQLTANVIASGINQNFLWWFKSFFYFLTLYIITGQFKTVARLAQLREGLPEYKNSVSRFHPKKSVLACGLNDEIIFFSAENSSIPFSNWKKDENKIKIGHVEGIRTMEWNVIS